MKSLPCSLLRTLPGTEVSFAPWILVAFGSMLTSASQVLEAASGLHGEAIGIAA